MITPSEARAQVEYDLSVTDQKPPIPYDVLAFNYCQAVRGLAEYADYVEGEREREQRRNRHLLTVGAHLAEIVVGAARAGRKTVRIHDVMAEAERRARRGEPE